MTRGAQSTSRHHCFALRGLGIAGFCESEACNIWRIPWRKWEACSPSLLFKGDCFKVYTQSGWQRGEARLLVDELGKISLHQIWDPHPKVHNRKALFVCREGHTKQISKRASRELVLAFCGETCQQTKQDVEGQQKRKKSSFSGSYLTHWVLAWSRPQWSQCLWSWPPTRAFNKSGEKNS